MTTINEQKVNYIWESLSAPVEEDRSIVYKEEIRIQNSNGTAASVLNSNNRLVFHVQDFSNIYLPSEAELEIEFKVVVKTTGANYAAGDKVTLIANGWNLFRRGMLKIGDQIIEDKDDVGLGSTIMDLVYKSKGYLNTVGSKSWSYYDTGAGLIDEGPVTVTGADIANLVSKVNPAYNDGFAQRRLFTDASSTYTIRLPLRDIFGYLRDSNVPIIGSTITFELDRDDREFKNILRGPAPLLDGKIEFTRAEIFMPKVKPSVEVGSQITKDMLSGVPTRVPFREFKTWTTDLADSTQTSWLVTSKSAKPVKVYFAFRKKTKINSQEQNGALLDNVGVTQITLDVNNKQYPEIAYTSNFATQNFMRLYQAYLQAGHKGGPENDEVDAALTAKEWANLYTIYCFDISKRDELIYENTTSSELRLNVSCGNIDKWAYCVVESEKEAVISGLNRSMTFLIK